MGIRNSADEITAMWKVAAVYTGENQGDGLPGRSFILTLCAKSRFIPGPAAGGVGKLSEDFKELNNQAGTFDEKYARR